MAEVSSADARNNELPDIPMSGVRRSTINNHGGLIWSIADLLRGDYKQSKYGRVILPLVVLRRLDCVLEPTMGGWSDSGKLHLDVSRNFPSSRREQAINAGRRQN